MGLMARKADSGFDGIVLLHLRSLQAHHTYSLVCRTHSLRRISKKDTVSSNRIAEVDEDDEYALSSFDLVPPFYIVPQNREPHS
jgi:hypothetical protein